MQFRVIVVTDPQTHTHTNKLTHRQDRLQYTALLSLARSVNIGVMSAGHGAGGRRHVGHHPRSRQHANRPAVGNLRHVPARAGLQQRHSRPSVSQRAAGTLGPRTSHTQQPPLGQLLL